jgi:glucose-6-phosphate isomerase
MPEESWRQVEAEASRLSRADLRLLARDPARLEFIWQAPNVEADLIKQPIDAGAMAALYRFARSRNLPEAIATLFSGGVVNTTENRPALHWALRASPDELPPGCASFQREQARAADFAARARSGRLGFEIRSILHIGIGGSDLGPRLVYDAVGPLAPQLDIRFCANLDPDDFCSAVSGLHPQSTLVIVVSKSFKTPETAANAQLARDWLLSALPEAEIRNHLVAVTAAPERALAWGAATDGIFPMDEAIGGRFSVWSSAGLSLQIALGPTVWEQFLRGARDMDRHFLEAPLEQNVPAKLAMQDVFLHSAMNIETRAVLAYAHRLRRLPAYLQQLEMESNGKRIADRPGGLIGATSPIVWGDAGTIGQHSFHQLLHQGTRSCAVEFIARLDASCGDALRARRMYANACAQSEAMLEGQSSEDIRAARLDGLGRPLLTSEQAAHLSMPGGKGSTFLLLQRLDAETLGSLLALYEHRTFAAGVLWGVNPFDQWGVERGKVVAERIEASLSGGRCSDRDLSTQRLIEKGRSI